MNPHEWLCLELRINPADADSYVALLWELGTIGLEECREQPGELLIKAFFPGTLGEQQLREEFQIAAATQSLAAVPLLYRSTSNPDDWVENYKKNFHAFPVGETFYIHPTWEPASPVHAVNLVIDPGHAFGTGTHESTQLCLLALEQLAGEAASLADIGTGSGILAMAALKLHPSLEVVALDVDFQATEMAKENMLRNHCSEIRLAAGPPTALRGPFDLVVANLAYGIFQQVAADITALTGSRLILSGFTVDQESLVTDLFLKTAPFHVERRREANGWACLQLAR